MMEATTTAAITNHHIRRHTTMGLFATCRTLSKKIIKQGYLYKLPDKSKLGSSLRKVVKRWFVFGMLNTEIPFMDYYLSEDDAFRGVPSGKIDLSQCLYVLSSQKKSHNCEHIFSIVLKGRVLSLSPSNRTSMLEWVSALENNLFRTGIIDCIGGENDYMPNTLSKHKPKNRLRVVSSFFPAPHPATTEDQVSHTRTNRPASLLSYSNHIYVNTSDLVEADNEGNTLQSIVNF
ncbi:hypothetical protein HELRODRAFT_193532 [Helobdella robusta]|uniref:PH domain-containing protein n=1 Tax=Helobdella robusta TaxID=6412 RepID=T1FV35_HELRO|nr:hypothetical protein HELRODRAFT_193532 [Helobdella robusta]ESN95531.1 hypothetical protein HELRODRAFT_193532 [Helobdella robusta]